MRGNHLTHCVCLSIKKQRRYPFKFSTITTAFVETVQNIHGNPKIIVSYRDPIFTRNSWTELFSCHGTQNTINIGT